jgi:hypothetical protein
VLQSLFLSVIGEARDRDVKAVEAFAYRYPEGSHGVQERFMTHRTIFPADFLADFGFRPVRAQGRVELGRLEVRGLVPVKDERLAEKAWRIVAERLGPAPVPQRP